MADDALGDLSGPTTGSMELLAPAGSPDALRAAIGAGADAVYLAGKRFGARAVSAAFRAADLVWARRVTRAAGRRLYVAVNTLVFDAEWLELEAHLDHLACLGVDAIIVQDLGVLSTLRRRGHRLPVHLSTQAAWDGAGGSALLMSLGVERIILPRETPLAVMAQIAARGPFAVEVFVHGASCYSISGRCWWSQALGGRSGNRGQCAQPCRRDYVSAPPVPGPSAPLGLAPGGLAPGGLAPGGLAPGGLAPEPNSRGARAEPWFSPGDLRLLDHLDALREAGVTSVKIEGRLKDPAYVAAVTGAYRAAMDGTCSSPHAARLARVFSRRTMPGYLFGPPAVWRTGAQVGHAGLEVGTITSLDLGRGLLEVQLSQELRAGDGVAWHEGSRGQGAPASGVRVTGARVTWVELPGPGLRRIRIKGPLPKGRGTGRHGIALFRTSGSDVSHPVDDWSAGWDPAWEEVPVALAVTGQEGSPLAITARGQGLKVQQASEALLSCAKGTGLESLLPERFGSLPAPLALGSLDLDGLTPGLFLPPKALKALRRDLVAALHRVLAAPGPGSPDSMEPAVGTRAAVASETVGEEAGNPRSVPLESETPGGIRIRLFRREDLESLRELRPSGGWILPAVGACRDGEGAADGNAPMGAPVGYWLPPAAGPDAACVLAPLVDRLPPEAEVLCLSWEAFELARLFPERSFRLDWTFNIANRAALDLLRGAGLSATSSPEAPRPLAGSVALARMNPLVSLSRFPPGEAAPAEVANSHGDRFTRLALGEGFWGLFLHRRPSPLSRPPPPLGLQVDVVLVEPGDSAALDAWLAAAPTA